MAVAATWRCLTGRCLFPRLSGSFPSWCPWCPDGSKFLLPFSTRRDLQDLSQDEERSEAPHGPGDLPGVAGEAVEDDVADDAGEHALDDTSGERHQQRREAGAPALGG